MLQSGRHQPHHPSSRRAHPWHRLRRAISQSVCPLPPPSADGCGGGCGSSKLVVVAAKARRYHTSKVGPSSAPDSRSAYRARRRCDATRRSRANANARSEQRRRPVRRRVVGGGAVRRRRRPRAVEAVPLGRLGVGRRAPVRPQPSRGGRSRGRRARSWRRLAAEDEAQGRVGDDLDAVGEARRCGFRPLVGQPSRRRCRRGRPAAHRRRPCRAPVSGRRARRRRRLADEASRSASAGARAARGSGSDAELERFGRIHAPASDA